MSGHPEQNTWYFYVVLHEQNTTVYIVLHAHCMSYFSIAYLACSYSHRYDASIADMRGATSSDSAVILLRTLCQFGTGEVRSGQVGAEVLYAYCTVAFCFSD